MINYSINDFFIKYHFLPNEIKLRYWIKKSLELFQKILNKRVYNGELKPSSAEIYDFLLKVGLEVVPEEYLQFKEDNRSIYCTISTIQKIMEYLHQMHIDLLQAQSQLNDFRSEILTYMEEQSLIDSRAIYQLFTGNSKKAPIQRILEHQEMKKISDINPIRRFLDKKPTSKPAFSWFRYPLKIKCKIGDQILLFTFLESGNCQYIPLFANNYTISDGKGSNFLIVENDDTAMALAFRHRDIDFDAIICAGGENNAGENFLYYIHALQKHFKGTWYYFGDYDYKGFEIFLNLVNNYYKLFNQRLEIQFLALELKIYIQLISAFGHRIPNTTKGNKKIRNYKKILNDRPSCLSNLYSHIKFNIENFLRLEQNVLIYCNIDKFLI